MERISFRCSGCIRVPVAFPQRLRRGSDRCVYVSSHLFRQCIVLLIGLEEVEAMYVAVGEIDGDASDNIIERKPPLTPRLPQDVGDLIRLYMSIGLLKHLLVSMLALKINSI